METEPAKKDSFSYGGEAEKRDCGRVFHNKMGFPKDKVRKAVRDRVAM